MRLPLVFAAVFLVAGCTSAQPGLGPEINVPAQLSTIQDAVDVAQEGATIVVSPGVYEESVRVRTKGLTIRGARRGSVIIDGEVQRENGIEVAAPDVSVQNLTVRNHTANGVLISEQRGFRVSYVTASNNARHGIHASDSQNGVIEQSYASGSADAGFSVSRCKPCDVVVRGNVAERNAVGYEGTNASGRMFVLGNRFSGNRVGMTSAAERQEDVALVGNLVSDNDEALSPAQADGAFGLGMRILSSTKNLVSRNLITANPGVGLAPSSSQDELESNLIIGNGQDVRYDDVPQKKSKAPRGIPFNQVAAPPLQPEMPAEPLPDRAPDVEKYLVPSEDLFDDRAAVRT
ncbi:right-handed parallel beta-helix repeat-containing protein [Lentzea sp. NBC_00516]|uniref:right-handed parallel beta-helix repeat-containing protein n=1 Tax=Lentzea sp. NBC_00516 TaxID=2903582 RepID=UPI002E7FCC45|nr:right-handed parallel beta-helix repeat-containing protein [Lentzea sp. NBC_00516]WUD22842.1 right-handed parallel beta-helix repeat-containing protein [Lentzea sp. NBC_00516]